MGMDCMTKKHYLAVWGSHIIGSGVMTEAEAKNFNADPENKRKQLRVIENVHANRLQTIGNNADGH